MFAMPPNTLQRMFSLIGTEDANGCKPWTGAVDERGKAVFFKHTRSPFPTKVSRILWEMTHGEIPKGVWVVRTCATKNCCAIEHLTLWSKGQPRVLPVERRSLETQLVDLRTRMELNNSTPNAPFYLDWLRQAKRIESMLVENTPNVVLQNG